MGPRAGAVRPGGRTSYVPSTVLVVRRTAVEAVGGFDEQLRVGEDVDLVWRLVEAGWRVRYAPELAAVHREPPSAPARLDRSRRYGTAAGPLAGRHPQAALSPPIAPVAAVLLATTGRPRLAATLVAGAAIRPARRMHAAGVPARDASLLAGKSTLAATAYAARWLVQIWSPVLFLLTGKRRRATRLFVATVMAARADDLAYGAGVWTGCLRAGTSGPLLPRRVSATRRNPLSQRRHGER